MTPRELTLVAKARTRNLERNRRETAWAVWHVAALMRIKKLPRFEKFVVPSSFSRKVVKQTPKQMRQIILMHHAIHDGITLKREKK